MKRFMFFVMGLFFFTHVFAAGLTAKIDRDHIHQQETLQLILNIDDQDPGVDPDLSPLQRNFEVISTAKSTQMSIINQKTSTQIRWVITLIAKQVGTLTIPAIQIGPLSSQPLSIEVSQAHTAANGGPRSQDVFLEVQSTPSQPYVQGQIIYKARLYYVANLENAVLTDPNATNAMVIRLGDDIQYQSMRYGRRYAVVERRYAIFPQNSGSFTINPPTFTAQIFNAPFGSPSGSLGAFFVNDSRSVHLTGDVIRLQIQPKPARFKTVDWLPVQKLTLTESWSTDPLEFHLGVPVTRTLTLTAVGLAGEQLPHLTQNALPGFEIYPEQPQVKTISQGDTLIGQRIEKIAMIPNRTGQITLPEIQIRGWNINNQREEIVSIPTHSIKVHHTLQQFTTGSTSTTQQPIKLEHNYWTWLSGGFFLAWAITFIAWRWSIKQPHLKPALQELENACKMNDPKRAKNAFLAWVKETGANATQLDSKDWTKEMEKLDAALYAHPALPWNGENFWKIFYTTIHSASKKPLKNRDLLPPLYL